MKHVHLIGIGGTGLSAIAKVLLEKGYTVSGSDRDDSPLFKSISGAGALTFLGHKPEQISGAELIIRSSAIPDDNPEVVAALARGIPVLKRADFLDELTQGKQTVAVAGSHGKTTTTAMLIWILHQLDTDPSFISGGMVSQLGCNAHAGTGPQFVIEADEYDYMFLGLTPRIAIITNIEHDHPDCFPTLEDYRAAFRSFLKRLPTDGIALVCMDDPETRLLIKEMPIPRSQCFGYGTSGDATYKAVGLTTINGYPQFELVYQALDRSIINLGSVQLRIPGHHNALNATGALSALHLLGMPMSAAIQAMSEFTGAGRRFEIIGDAGGVTIIDDYGHHPSEIAATLDAAQSCFSGHRIWAIWQPHTYTRTKNLQDEFEQALDLADKVLVLQIYAARESDPGFSAQHIAEALSANKAHYIADFKHAAGYLLDKLIPGDIAIIFSAGNAIQLSRAVLEGLQQRERAH